MYEIKGSARLIPSQGPEGESSLLLSELLVLLVILGVPWHHVTFSLCVSLCAFVFTWPSQKDHQSLNLGRILMQCEFILT